MSIVKEDLLSISPDALAPAATEAKAEADRKSTRLNSSHWS